MHRSMGLKQKTTSGLFWSFTDLISNQGIQFILQVILARILLVKDFGLIGMITIFIALANSIVDSGFSQVLIREPELKQDDYSTVFFFNLSLAVGLYLVLFFSSSIISEFFSEPQLVLILRVLSLVVIINSFGIVQRVMLVRNIDFKTQAKISLVASISSGMIAVFLAYFGFGVWSLVFRTLIMQFMSAFLLSLHNKWKPTLIFRQRSFFRFFNCGSRLLVAGLINTIYNNLYFVIIGRFFSTLDLGYYTNASKLETAASVSITGALQRVSYPVLCSMQKNENRLREGFSKIIRTSAFLVFPLMVFLAAVADNLIKFLFGDKWLTSIPYFQILCIAGMLYPLHAINLNILQVKGRTDLFLRLEIIKKTIFTITIIVSLLLDLGIIGLVWVMVINSYFAYFVNTLYSGKMISYSFRDQLKDVIPAFGLSFIMGILVYLAGMFISNGVLFKLIFQLFIGITTYICLCKLFKVREISIVRNLLFSILKRKG